MWLWRRCVCPRACACVWEWQRERVWVCEYVCVGECVKEWIIKGPTFSGTAGIFVLPTINQIFRIPEWLASDFGPNFEKMCPNLTVRKHSWTSHSYAHSPSTWKRRCLAKVTLGCISNVINWLTEEEGDKADVIFVVESHCNTDMARCAQLKHRLFWLPDPLLTSE